MKFNVISCYALAWRSFSKWWIPLCLISGTIVALEIVPRVLVRADVNEFMAVVHTIVDSITQSDLGQLENALLKAQAQMFQLIRKVAVLGLYIFPFVALLTVILLMYANRAVKNKRDAGRPIGTLAYIAFIHVLLAIGKAVAFLLFVFPGFYLYIKLYFVSLIMLEEKRDATTAIRISWQMTRGNFWQLFLLVFLTTVIQLLVLPTVIGAIPATGFANTARAAAFRMIWEEGNYARATPEPLPDDNAAPSP